MSARTLKDDEYIFAIQEAYHHERQSLPEISVSETLGPIRVKPRHRARQTLRFVFKVCNIYIYIYIYICSLILFV